MKSVLEMSSISGFVPTPRRKKGFRNATVGLPFPNYALGETELPVICRCTFDGHSFYVQGMDMHTLHYNGSFGTSSLTYRGPSYQDSSFKDKPYYRKKTGDVILDTDNFMNGGLQRTTLPCKRPRYDSLNSNKSDGISKNGCKPHGVDLPEEILDKLSSVLTENPSPISMQKVSSNVVHANGSNGLSSSIDSTFSSHGGEHVSFDDEKLILMPEEVMFLSFGVGCLSIQNTSGDVLDYRKLWSSLSDKNPDFPVLYAVYHYFRAKNWVPKCGKSYGASYVLYESSPEMYHSTYILHVLGLKSQHRPTWTELHGWQRLSQHVGKNVLLCHVTLPEDFRSVKSDPNGIFKIKLKESCIRRWKPAPIDNS